MATERQSPDAIITQTNLSGALSAIQDDPDAPDANWWTAPDNNADTVVHVSFPTPTGNPTVGANLQEFKIWVRKSPGQSGTPTVRVDLYENGGLLATIIAASGVTSGSGQLFSATWNANLLGTADGSLVEIYIYGTKSGGSPTARATVEVGAVEWNVTYSAGAIQWLAGITNGFAAVSGSTKVSKKLAGASACVASASGATKVLRRLSGDCAGLATISGVVKVSRKLTGAVSGVASVVSNLTVTTAGIALAGVVSSISSVSGTLKRLRRIDGVSAGVASSSGTVKVVRGLAGVIVGVASISGAVKTLRRLSGITVGSASATASLSIIAIRYLAGLVQGAATVWGALGVLRRRLTIYTDVTISQDLNISMTLKTHLAITSTIVEK